MDTFIIQRFRCLFNTKEVANIRKFTLLLFAIHHSLLH